MKMSGARLTMDLTMDGKTITRPGWVYNYAPDITDERLGYENSWDVPSERHAAEYFRVSLLGVCLMDQNFLWAHLCITDCNGQPITWRTPWQCYIQPYQSGRKIPGAVDRITPGLWIGQHGKPETHEQRPLILHSYVEGVVIS